MISKSWLVPLLLLAGAGTIAIWPLPSAAADSARDKAVRLITELESDASHRPLTARAIARSRQALKNGASFERKKSLDIARVFDETALSWAEAGRAERAAAQLEREASEAEAQLTQVETQLHRARALLEETLARRARATEKLKALQEADKSGSDIVPKASPPVSNAPPTKNIGVIAPKSSVPEPSKAEPGKTEPGKTEPKGAAASTTPRGTFDAKGQK